MRTLLVALTLIASISSQAQTTAKDGLVRLKANLENSKANLADYQKNLEVVKGNIDEIKKARQQVETQRAEVKKSFTENRLSADQLQKNEEAIKRLVFDDTKDNQNDEKKIQELNRVLALIKINQEKRSKNIAQYEEQLKQIQKERLEWATRIESLNKTQAQVDNKLKNVANQETEWLGKQKGYQGEIGRWQKEVDRNKKLLETYNSLAEVKE